MGDTAQALKDHQPAPVGVPPADGSGVHPRPTARRVERFDLGTLGKLERTPTGGVIVPAYVSRTGVQVYRDADGNVVRELRLADEVLSEASVRSFENAAVTDDHPPELVSPENARAYNRGLARNARVDGSRVAMDLVITDAEGIRKIESGEWVECSAGYTADVERVSGVFDGEPYDAIQRNVRANHVALGPAGWGRAGASVRLRLDAAHEITGAPRSVREKRTDSMKTIKVDGIPYEAGSESHLQAVEKLLERRDAAAAEAKTRHDAEIAKVRGELDELKGTKVGLETRAAKAETDLAETKRKLDAAMSEEELDKRVESRLSLIDRARGVLGATFDGKGEDQKSLSDSDIMRACLDKAGVAMDEDDLKNDAIVRGAFLAATSKRDESGDDEEPEKPEEPVAKGDRKRDRKDGSVRMTTVEAKDGPTKPQMLFERIRKDNAEFEANAHKGFAIQVTRD